MEDHKFLTATITNLKDYYKRTYINPIIDTTPTYDDDDHSRNQKKLAHKLSLPLLIKVSKQVYSGISDSSKALTTNKRVRSIIDQNVRNNLLSSYRARISESDKKLSQFESIRHRIRISPSKKKKQASKLNKGDSTPLSEKTQPIIMNHAKSSPSKGTPTIKLEWNKIDYRYWKPEVRQCCTMVTHDKNVYLFGGLGNELCEKLIILQPDNEDTIDKYIWKTIKQIGVTPKGRYGHLSVTNKRDKDIYIMGGARKFNTLTKIRECLNDIYKYNIDSNEWKELICGGSPIEPRRNHAGCIVGKHLFIHGGINQQGAFTKDNAILNLTSLKWITGKSDDTQYQFEEGVAFHTCTLVLSIEKMSHPSLSMYKLPDVKLGSRTPKIAEEGLYFYGGKYRNGKVLDKLRILKIGGKKTSRWIVPIVHGAPPEGRYGHCMIYYAELGIMILYGGRNDDCFKNTGSSCPGSVYILNLVDQLSWSKVDASGSIPSPRYCFGNALLGDRIYIFGGLNDSNYCNSDLYSLKISSVMLIKKEDKEEQKSISDDDSPRAAKFTSPAKRKLN